MARKLQSEDVNGLTQAVINHDELKVWLEDLSDDLREAAQKRIAALTLHWSRYVVSQSEQDRLSLMHVQNAALSDAAALDVQARKKINEVFTKVINSAAAMAIAAL